MDGDNWSVSNVRTGGRWRNRIPYNAEIAKKLKKWMLKFSIITTNPN